VHKIELGEALPQVEAEVIAPNDTVVDLGPLSQDQVAELERELGEAMPHTGADTDALLLATLARSSWGRH
jgi:hypothetical protein